MAKAEKVPFETSSNQTEEVIILPDYDTKIAELAYFKAENRGFEPGYELDDWLEAEQEFLQTNS